MQRNIVIQFRVFSLVLLFDKIIQKKKFSATIVVKTFTEHYNNRRSGVSPSLDC